MTVEKSNVANQIVKKTKSEVGTLHFFKHIAVVEFNEGTHIDLISVGKTLSDILEYFGDSKPFGVVANRVNSYSISLLDVKDARQALPNLAAYGIVSYNSASRMNAEIESSFCYWEDICFNNLYQGLETIHRRVKINTNASLN